VRSNDPSLGLDVEGMKNRSGRTGMCRFLDQAGVQASGKVRLCRTASESLIRLAYETDRLSLSDLFDNRWPGSPRMQVLALVLSELEQQQSRLGTGRGSNAGAGFLDAEEGGGW
jgi:hypothetical protein